MAIHSDLRTLAHLAFKPVRGDTHAQRLESFYSSQSKDYDQFRKRLLHGRERMYQAIPQVLGGTWYDVGGGTGSNLEYVGPSLADWADVKIVDLSPSLLDVAKQRIKERSWKNVSTIEADATTFVAPMPADVITFSYSLTMMPDPIAVLDNALQNLKPGGVLAVVDFYVSPKYPASGRVRHSWWTRHFWPMWFGSDNVFLTPHVLQYLTRRVCVERLDECVSRVPYVPLGRVPHYMLIGRKV